MVDTRLLDLDAGNSPDRVRRRLLLALPGLMAAGGALSAPAGVITSDRSYMGARLLKRVTPTGMPEVRPDTFGPMTLFVFPSAVAVTPVDIYIADPGLGALLRYDPALDAMAVIQGAQVNERTRIAALVDGSVLVANGGALPARRFSRSGRNVQSIAPELGSAFYDEVVADPGSGRFYGLDRVQGRLEEIMPHGRGATVVSGVMPDLPVAMAMDRHRLYVAGRACGCIEAIDLFGSRGSEEVGSDFGNVIALAAGDGWLVAADGAERLLRVYRDGILRADPGFAELNLVNPKGMAIANHILYVADPGGRRIATFRLRP